MRLFVLGKSKKDKGDQLEELTRSLLTSLGYTRIGLKRSGVAGEIDITGEYVIPAPTKDKIELMIGECKAYGRPVDMPDWLKFLGKLFVKQASHQNVNGCFIALSGVNGHVQESFKELGNDNIRLIDQSTLIEYLKESHGLADPEAVRRMLIVSTTRLPNSIDVAYHGGQVYWFISYDKGTFTLLDAKGEYLPREAVAAILRLKLPQQPKNYIDLKDDAQAQLISRSVERMVLGVTMAAGGRVAMQKLESCQKEFKLSELLHGIAELTKRNWIQQQNDEISFTNEIETSPSVLAEMFRAFLSEIVLIECLGCEWYDRHINEAFLDEALRLQEGMQLEPEERQHALQLIRWSPLALLYALRPDPLIVHHRKNYPSENDKLNSNDRKQFMRSLYGAFVTDFSNPHAATYFGKTRLLKGIHMTTTVSININDAEVMEATIEEGKMIVQLAEEFGGTFVHVLKVHDLPQP